MARIIVQAVRRDGKPRRWTLSERIVPQNLAEEHYATQLLERLSWATADAEALESHTPDRAADHDDDTPHVAPPISARDTKVSPRSPSHPINTTCRVKA
jgi:hypothetical protein